MSETIKSADVRLKRAYDPAGPEDGRRILVDRLWPRGLSKAEAGIDEWLKDLAPSTELRKWFGHDPARWAEFQRRYEEEIHGHPEALAQLRKLAREGTLALVYSARDELHNDAVVLRRVLLEEQRATPEEDDRARRTRSVAGRPCSPGTTANACRSQGRHSAISSLPMARTTAPEWVRGQATPAP